jgi:ubiquinone/menaquinone biosynthesis C-methylase UbiE
MVLHHVPDADASVREIVRVLRPGGMLVLREHDCASPTLAAVIDTLHGFYAAVWYVSSINFHGGSARHLHFINS